MFKPASLKRNFTEGPLFFKIILFAIPIMLTSVLQTLYNMADHIVVGQFSGDPNALAAVGSTGALTGLVVNFLVGISAGTGVVVAQAYGAKHDDLLSRAVHTSVSFAALGGIVFSIIGFIISKPALMIMDTKPELLDSAVLYMRIICLGIPASAVYNFSAASLRAVGDSKTPLLILSSSGIVNVILNVVFVILFNMSVDGVSLATVISQYISAAWVVLVLMRRKSESYSLNLRKLGIDKGVLLRVLRFGVPAGIQSSLFSISNIVITSAANSFSTIDISAKTIMGNVDGVVYNAMNSYMHASMTVMAQNYGAGKYKRINKAFGYCLLQVVVIGVVISQALLLVGNPIMSLFIDSADPNKAIILEKAHELLELMLSIYFLCGIMETLSGSLRGLGYSIAPMMIVIGGVCGIRVLWIMTLFRLPEFNSMYGLLLAYPVSWTITSVALGICCLLAWKKLRALRKKKEEEEEATEEEVTAN